MRFRLSILLLLTGLQVAGASVFPQSGERAIRTTNLSPHGLLVTPARGVGGNTNPVPGFTPTNQAAGASILMAYYFHGTIRCETCLLIETLARGVVEQQFAAEVTAQRLVWKSVNYDLPENRHYLTEFKLPCPSLVLVLQQEGRPRHWKLLGDTWQLAHDPAKLKTYVETEVRNFLIGGGLPPGAGGNRTPNSPGSG